MKRTIPVLLLTVLIHGCAGLTTGEPLPREVQQVQVFYATDRKPGKDDSGMLDFGSKRGRKISYGIAAVDTWPVEYEEENADGEMREIISQPLATRFVQAANLDKERFFRRLRDPEQPGNPDELIMFVHGFKRNFRAAAEHAALIAESIGFNGRMVFWTWPSQDSASGYLNDRTTLMWSQKHLAQFITDLVQKGKPRRLVLIAHSLGTQGLTQALFEEIGADQLKEWNVVDRLVLLAPDIDLGIFRRDIVPAINRVGIPTTVYASSTDLALQTSTRVNGYPRAGDSSDKIYTFAGIETIDATQVTQSFLGHSYYRRSFGVIDDLHLMIVRNKPIAERPGLKPRRKDGQLYWKLK